MENPYADEARERWGNTPSYQESMRRTAGYADDDWQEIKSEAEQIARDFATAMQTNADGRPIAERHRQHIDRWFYPCSPHAHLQLGEMYVADPRFAAYWDNFEPGLARFVRDAIRANAAD